jgi:molecular chaperone DnaK
MMAVWPVVLYDDDSMKIRKTVGIDLGTTNSVIALLDATDGALITGRDELGHAVFPSVVGYRAEEGRAVAGPAALRLREEAGGTVSSVKRSMGLDRDFAVGPCRLTAPEVSARILRHLREVLARTLRDDRYLLDSAVITMPAYFNHDQIEATRRAGELAGFEVAELLHEPTAAAIYYGWALDHGDASYLVYDLGGGTFDVSVIRRRHGDYEVLGVCGDPFLGGDDFDRLLASWLLHHSSLRAYAGRPEFQPGTRNFERLVHAAEQIKTELSAQERVARHVPDLLTADDGTKLALEAEVDRATFQRLIREKIDRTVECCQVALGRAREKAGVRLSDIDYVLLVGGSSKIPLVRETVRTAFCNPARAEHARSAEPLVHEPDLCVAYGAAIQAAAHGVRFTDLPGDLELHVTSPPGAAETAYTLTGIVRGPGAADVMNGGSVRVQLPAAGVVEEAFFDERGTFAQPVELQPDRENLLHLAVCDPAGADLAFVPFRVCHRPGGRRLGRGVLPAQLITKPLKIQILDRARRPVKQTVAPVGASLPGTFACTCRTVDQSGRIVVPVYEENRLIKELLIEDIDPDLPLGSPVEVEFRVDVKHNIQVELTVQAGGPANARVATAYIQAAATARPPTRADVEEVGRTLDELLAGFSGGYRTRVQAQRQRLLRDLGEALAYGDEPKAVQRMAELRDLVEQLQANRGRALDPPWPRFAHLVKHCLHEAAAVADRTGWARDELFEQVYAQERYAEQAYEERNQILYAECFDNLGKLAGYLERLRHDALPRPWRGPVVPAEEAREEIERCRSCLESLVNDVRTGGRPELEARLGALARQAAALPERVAADPHAVIREARRLLTAAQRIGEELAGRRHDVAAEDAGLLGQ